MKKSPFILLSLMASLVVVFGGCAYITGEAIEIPATPHPPAAEVRNVTPEEIEIMTMISSRYPAFIYIDVRTPEEYAGGHIDDAIDIDFNAKNFSKEIDKLDKNPAYIVYCRTGSRSAAASKVMVELGFRNINNMTGGYADWVAAGRPVNK